MRRSGSIIVVLAVAIIALVGCAEEEYPAAHWAAQHPDAAASAGGDAVPAAVFECRQSRAESLPARLVAMSSTSAAPSVSAPILVSDIFQRFTEVCGGCHGPAVDPPGQGGFQIVRDSDFASLMTAQVLQHVTLSVCPTNPNPANPDDPMPPCSSPNGASYTARTDSDPVKQFAELVGEWLHAGSPSSFTPSGAAGAGDAGAQTPQADGDAGSAGAYVMSPSQGNAMTNIGNCVPSTAMMQVNQPGGAALDAMFASLQAQPSGSAAQQIGLPEHLGDTDLVSFDSAVLAQEGVIAYAPGYPLWSDDAGKLRYVRVPRGQSIHFNKATQQFEIPPNTRFYKTFMKQIIDTDNSYRYRKIETRLIVSRPDQNNADGTVTQTALFGSYKWNDDESDAVLVETPLRDGSPFADTVLLYDVDEPLAADVLSGLPTDPEEALLEAQAARHYAIPSSQRCVQCHMGSPSEAFVLGFTPLQINRRPVGVGGVIEATGPDELTQLQRFIDAGVITGIDSPSDVLPLELSQGSRTPRNDYELTAQGYVLGNCSHCHNPRGFPSVQNPVLVNVLNFLPGPSGGIFQFPLERYSPRIGRGLTGSTPIPYITPSLVDLPKTVPDSANSNGVPGADWFVNGLAGSVAWVDYAPWRSIIYRNVDSAFAYTDDFALFPHMPMNTPGYDARAKRILGDWMVSIPSVRKQPELVEYAYQIDSTPADNIGSPVVDSSPQPYVEVLPGAPAYDDAVVAAQQRLSIFHTGTNPALPLVAGYTPYSRYADPGQTEDILDPAVLADPICHPIPVADVSLYENPLPEHPHWVTTDLTNPPGPWAPRQPNWPQVLVEQQIPAMNGGCTTVDAQQLAYADQVAAVGLLPSATLDQVRDFVTTPVPFGLWQVQPGCDFSSVPTVQSFTGTQRPHWMDVANAPPDAPVYMQAPGASVFKMICINCHGPNADSNGRLAQNLATMTGGNALVADFRDGLFGPRGATESAGNRHAIFGSDALLVDAPDASASWTQVTDDDRAARYMAWMGLGGTSVNIPVAVLQIVAITKVLDQQRTISAATLSANMLSQAKSLCLGLLGPGDGATNPVFLAATLNPGLHGYLDAKLNGLNESLIPSNGDAELWLHLCSVANPPPVHVLHLGDKGELALAKVSALSAYSDMAPSAVYPPDTPVGNESGGVDPSLDADNDWPWCVDDTTATGGQPAWIVQNALPVCPAAVNAANEACRQEQPGCFGQAAANQWAVRGAINAGFAVYTYVSSIENSGPSPDYNQCSLLP